MLLQREIAEGQRKKALQQIITIREVEAPPAIRIKTEIQIGQKIEISQRMTKLFALLLVLVVGTACESHMVLGEMRDMPGSWEKRDHVEFRISEIDSVEKYDVFLHLRNTNDYPFNNIHLIASIKFPHGKTVADTLEYRMANADGTWLGTGIGTVKENKLRFKENVRFSEEGTYILTVSQAVRNNGEVRGVNQLEGITEVGYSIEKANQ